MTTTSSGDGERTTRVLGVLLGGACSDALGAAVEGHNTVAIRLDERFASATRGRGCVDHYVMCTHMGLASGERQGMYTDDTETTLALAASLVEQRALDAQHVAQSYAAFWADDSAPSRGYPGTAERVLRSIQCKWVDYRRTGTMCFPEGSWANGAAMRIAPVGVAFSRCTDDAVLHEAVRQAVLSSHVHPDAVDAAFVQAKMVALLLEADPAATPPAETFLARLISVAHTDVLKQHLALLQPFLAKLKALPPPSTTPPENYLDPLDHEVKLAVAPGFQLRARDAITQVVWYVLRYLLFVRDPETLITQIVSAGGDADTVGAMAGSCAGALCGVSWIPQRLVDGLEDGVRGRSYIVAQAAQLATLDLRSVKAVPPWVAGVPTTAAPSPAVTAAAAAAGSAAAEAMRAQLSE